MDLLARIKQSPLVFDGAMGTEIYDRGVFIQACYDELCLSNPRLVLQIHRDYIEAGAQVIETNTFGANPIKLKTYGLAERTEAINRAGVKLAREAASASGGEVFVAGAIGPCTESNQRMPEAFALEVENAFRTQMAALDAEGVDLFLLETFSNLNELLLAARVAKEFRGAVLASFALTQRGETALGTRAEAMMSALDEDPNVDIVGLNCGTGPSGTFDALQAVLPLTGKPVVVMPNAGFPREISGRVMYMTSPEYFTEYAKKYIEIGVRGVGGCCGTTPAHIRTMARAVKSLPGVKRLAAVKPRVRTETAVQVVPPERKSRFAAKLLSGEKVTSVELLPPKSSNMTALLAKAKACAAAGIDAINIPDGPRASARISPMIAALTIQREVGIETILHFCCRDRNLIGMQADLLGATPRAWRTSSSSPATRRSWATTRTRPASSTWTRSGWRSRGEPEQRGRPGRQAHRPAHGDLHRRGGEPERRRPRAGDRPSSGRSTRGRSSPSPSRSSTPTPCCASSTAWKGTAGRSRSSPASGR